MTQHSLLSYSNSYQGLTQRKGTTVTRNNFEVTKCQPTDDQSDDDDDSSQSSSSSYESENHSSYFGKAVVSLSIIASLCFFSLGWLRTFYGHSFFSVTLKCEPQGCILKEQHVGGDVSMLHLHRHQLVRTELVRLALVGKRKKERKVVQYVGGPSSSSLKMANLTSGDHITSFALVYHEEEDHHHDHHEIPLDHPNVYPVTPHDRNHDDNEKLATYVFKYFDMSLKQDRIAYNNLKQYIGGRRTHAHVEYVGESALSLLGIIFICVGIVGFLLAMSLWRRRMRQNM
jgi:hypothetical protein